MSHGTFILFNISLFKLSELSPSWVLNVTDILENIISHTDHSSFHDLLLANNTIVSSTKEHFFKIRN